MLQQVDECKGFTLIRGAAIFSMLFWLGSTLASPAVGLVLAAIAGKQVSGAGRLATDPIGQPVVSSVIVWIGLPVLAVMLVLTLIGLLIAVGIGVPLFALGLSGYVAAGTRLGQFITERSRPVPWLTPYLAAVTGLLLLRVDGLVPFISGFGVAIASLYGGGTLAYYAYQGWRGRRAPVAPLPRRQLTPVQTM